MFSQGTSAQELWGPSTEFTASVNRQQSNCFDGHSVSNTRSWGSVVFESLEQPLGKHSLHTLLPLEIHAHNKGYRSVKLPSRRILSSSTANLSFWRDHILTKSEQFTYNMKERLHWDPSGKLTPDDYIYPQSFLW